jgi:hypothetical protein
LTIGRILAEQRRREGYQEVLGMYIDEGIEEVRSYIAQASIVREVTRIVIDFRNHSFVYEVC